MPPERRRHGVAPDTPGLLEALAAPFGTYVGVAVCRAVPGARSLDALAVDLLCALGKTESLTRRRRPGTKAVEQWIRAHEVVTLFVTGADGLPGDVRRELCGLGDQAACDIVLVSAQPTRQLHELAGIAEAREVTCLRVDAASAPVQPPVGAPLPDVGFPALPAACEALLEPVHAARARAIYDECLAAAFDALPYDRVLEQGDVDGAFRAALARAPDLGAVPLAAHALRAAGLLRGYDVTVEGTDLDGVAFDDLLTADRLDQLGRLVSAEQAAAGALAGLPSAWGCRRQIHAEGTWVSQGDVWHRLTERTAALVRAWEAAHPGDRDGPRGAPTRPADARRRLLWRTPPPERLRVSCRMIECHALRRIANPPMEWAEPPRSYRRNGRSAHGS